MVRLQAETDNVQGFAGQALELVVITETGGVNHVEGKCGWRRAAGPSPGETFTVEPIAQRLLVEARLGPSRT